MPAVLLAFLGRLAATMVTEREALTPKQARRVLQATVQDLQKGLPRPWGIQVPLLAQL